MRIRWVGTDLVVKLNGSEGCAVAYLTDIEEYKSTEISARKPGKPSSVKIKLPHARLGYPGKHIEP